MSCIHVLHHCKLIFQYRSEKRLQGKTELLTMCPILVTCLFNTLSNQHTQLVVNAVVQKM